MPPSDPSELDPSLDEWLTAAREVESMPPSNLDTMLEAVEGKVANADKSTLFWLRSRPTWMRRAFAGGVAATVLGVSVMLSLRDDFGRYPTGYMVGALSALGVLLAVSVHHALRPLHRPPLPRWAQAGLVAVTLLSTLFLALLSPADATDPAASSLLSHVSPCLFYGLLLGLPVYFALRLVDRAVGSFGGLTPLLGGCAAGLAGNLFLQLHCPRNDPQHLMLGHFTVALLFVAGLGIARVLVPPGK